MMGDPDRKMQNAADQIQDFAASIRDGKTPFWAHPLAILASPFVAAFFGWLFATVANIILWGAW